MTMPAPISFGSTPLFCLSGQEIARLEFVAWLVGTGRLTEWPARLGRRPPAPRSSTEAT